VTEAPVLSVIIPTCDRPDTLAVCLRTFLRQPCDDVEIVVQDNKSDARTTAIVEAAMKRDPRIRWSRLDRRVSMRANFEAGINAARGDYVTIIGDDDAMADGALTWISRMLRQHTPIALRWRLVAYYWPSLTDCDIGYLQPKYDDLFGGWAWGDAADLKQRMLDGRMEGLWESLQIYPGAVSRQLIEATRARTGGILFQYHIPDVYVHTAMLLVAGDTTDRRFIDVQHPLSVYGLSGHSNGSSWFAGKAEKRGSTSPIATWQGTVAADTDVKQRVQHSIRCMKYHDYAALFIAAEFGLVSEEEIDHKAWIAAIVREVDSNRWQIAGFAEAKPSKPYEYRVLQILAARFGELSKKASISPPSRLKTVEADAPNHNKLCLRSVASGMPDDVETAVAVLNSLIPIPADLPARVTIDPDGRQDRIDELRAILHDVWERDPLVKRLGEAVRRSA
jgi:hypothetical protein